MRQVRCHSGKGLEHPRVSPTSLAAELTWAAASFTSPDTSSAADFACKHECLAEVRLKGAAGDQKRQGC